MKKKFYKKPELKEDFFFTYLKARKEYFSYFHSKHQKKKEEAYLQALKKYREYKPLIRKEYPLVQDYSLKHPSTPSNIAQEEKPLLKREFTYQADTEISMGTIEDYLNYKNNKII